MDNERSLSLHSPAVCEFCSKPLRALHAREGITVAYCDTCEVGRLDPLPAVRDRLTHEGLRAGGGERTAPAATDDAPQVARTFRRKLRRLLRYGAIRDLLQVDCGSGAFLREAQEAGIPHVLGLDTNAEAVATARAAGLDAHHGSVEALPAAQQFDAIVLLDALAHRSDPLAFLLALRPHLRSGGHLFVMTPNICSRVARWSGANWAAFANPADVHYYGQRGIRLLLERTGFDPVWVRGTGHYVTLGRLSHRLARLAPRLAAMTGGVMRLLCLDGRVVYAPNGAMDVVARARRGSR